MQKSTEKMKIALRLKPSYLSLPSCYIYTVYIHFVNVQLMYSYFGTFKTHSLVRYSFIFLTWGSTT